MNAPLAGSALGEVAIDRVDPPDPRMREQPERRRRGQRSFPEIEGEERDERDEPGAPGAPHPARPTDDGEEHLVDVLVRGLFLPTRQILPPAHRAARAN